MTRINAGIPPSELHYKHLLAEHYEIKRIPNCIKKGRFKMSNIPSEFKLGKGHVKFFYNKLDYLRKRYEQIYNECIERGYEVTYFGASFDNLPKELMNDYMPTNEAIQEIKSRINERLLVMKTKKNY